MIKNQINRDKQTEKGSDVILVNQVNRDNQANQDSDLLNGALTRRIIGCAMRVHSTLGNGFQEVIYQRALSIEMQYDNLKFER